MVDYITANDVIIFDPRYDKPLSLKLNIQSNLKKIIFSNYELNNDIFEAYENSNFDNFALICSNFNQPLGNSLANCTALTHIFFGYLFNQPLGNSLDNCTKLTHIHFCCEFNQQLTNSLDNCTVLTHINFGHKFNYPLCDFLYNHPLLVHLGLGYYFNQKVNLPLKLRSLSLNSNNGNLTDYLPNNIKELELEQYFDLELDNLPSSIKKITFDKISKYNQELNCLPTQLSILQLPSDYNKQILSIPNALKKLICSKNYPCINDFSGIDVCTYLKS